MVTSKMLSLCDTVQSGRNCMTLRRNVLSPFVKYPKHEGSVPPECVEIPRRLYGVTSRTTAALFLIQTVPGIKFVLRMCDARTGSINNIIISA